MTDAPMPLYSPEQVRAMFPENLRTAQKYGWINTTPNQSPQEGRYMS